MFEKQQDGLRGWSGPAEGTVRGRQRSEKYWTMEYLEGHHKDVGCHSAEMRTLCGVLSQGVTQSNISLERIPVASV